MIFTCPMIVAAFTESYMLAAVLTGLTVLGFQGLAEVACELESPFLVKCFGFSSEPRANDFSVLLELMDLGDLLSHRCVAAGLRQPGDPV